MDWVSSKEINDRAVGSADQNQTESLYTPCKSEPWSQTVADKFYTRINIACNFDIY